MPRTDGATVCISVFVPPPGSAVTMLAVVDKAQCWARGWQPSVAARAPLTQPSGISSSAPGSTASRRTRTIATGGRWSWTCRYGEPSCLCGPGIGYQRTVCENSQFEDAVAYLHPGLEQGRVSGWSRGSHCCLTSQPRPSSSHKTSTRHARGAKARAAELS